MDFAFDVNGQLVENFLFLVLFPDYFNDMHIIICFLNKSGPPLRVDADLRNGGGDGKIMVSEERKKSRCGIIPNIFR